MDSVGDRSESPPITGRGSRSTVRWPQVHEMLWLV